ncbi:zinc knuckle CX2CX4HX4C containing protein [Tanacetum coccineum]
MSNTSDKGTTFGDGGLQGFCIDVAATFGVPLTTVGDLQKLINDIDAGKHDELLSELLNGRIVWKLLQAFSCGEEVQRTNQFNPLFVPYADPVFYGVNISIPRKVVEKVSTRFEHTLYGYFIGKRMAFPVVEYYARNNWAKHGLKRIMMNSKGFFFFKFDSRAGLEAVLEGGPWLIRKSPIILKKWSMDTRFLKEELTRIPIWVKLHDVPIQVFEEEVNSDANLVDVVTIGIPSLSEDDLKPKKTACSRKTNDGFQTVGKTKKRKGKSKSTNGGQFTGPSVKHNVRYEPKATTSAPKKGTTYVGYTSQSTPMLKTTGNSSKKDNLSMSNSFSALNEEEEDVENVYDESANLIQNTKAGGSSSFTAAVACMSLLYNNSIKITTSFGDSEVGDRSYLCDGYEITVIEDDEAPTKRPVEFEEAVASFFDDHPDLLCEFSRFLPEASASASTY